MATTMLLIVYGIVVLYGLVFLFVEASSDFLRMYGIVVLYGLVFLVVESIQIILVYPRLTRGKGYPPPTAMIVIAICVVLGVALFMLLCLIDVFVLDRENWVYRTLGYELVAAGFICALSLEVTARLPEQETRRSGPRHLLFPYQSLGELIHGVGWALAFSHFLLALIGLGFSFIFWNLGVLVSALEFAMFSGLFMWPASALVYMWGSSIMDVPKWSSLPDALDVLRRDNRPPVLFLRGFRYDTEPFIDVQFWASTNPAMDLRLGRPPIHIKDTFEKFFGGAVTTRLGPFIALGNPEDYLPPSHAAARLYLSDMEWFDGFQQFARESACILIRVSTSDNLDQELRFLLSAGLQTKLYILTPPELFDFGHNFLELVHLDGLLFSWPEFARTLNRLGYNALEENMPNGAVIGFDSRGRAEVVFKDAKSAADYIGAIEARLLSNQINT